MKNKNAGFYFSALIVVIYASLFIYVAFRAWHLSFTHDESLSYALIRGDLQWLNTANHHMLNTFLMRACCYFFGDSEFSLRLPNVILFGVYLWVCHRLLRQEKNLWLLVTGMSFLLLNPFILDYFSLARGYGLSLGFMMLSLYFLLRGNSREFSFPGFVQDFVLSVFFAGLALFSNLPAINYYIAVIIIFIFEYVRSAAKRPGFSFRNNVVFTGIILLSLLPLLFAIRRLLLLNHMQQLYFGTGSFSDCISSLIAGSMFSKGPYIITNIITYSFMGIFLLAVVILILKKYFYGPFYKITFLLALIVLGLLSERYFFGFNYPKERAAIYLIPLFALFLYYFSSYFIQHIPSRFQTIYSVGLCLILASPLICNFSSNINVTYAYTWKYDAHTKDVISVIEKTQIYSMEKKGRITLSNHWLFEPALNYYIRSRNLNIEPVDRNGVRSDTDFIYDFSTDKHQANYGLLTIYDDIGASLYQKTKAEKE